MDIILDITNDCVWYDTWTCKISSLKFLKSLAFLSSFGISLRTTYVTTLGLAKISSLKFFKRPALCLHWTIYEITHGLENISSLKFFKTSRVVFNGVSLRTTCDITHGLAKISSLKFLKGPGVLS